LRRFYASLKGTWNIEERRNPDNNDEDQIVIDDDAIRYIYCGGGYANGPYVEDYDSQYDRISKRRDDVKITFEVIDDGNGEKLKVTYSYGKNGWNNPDICLYVREEDDYYYYTEETKEYPICDYTLPPAQQATEPPRTDPPKMCLDDIEVLHQVGNTDYPVAAVEIVNQDSSVTPHTVEVKLNQQWSSGPIDHIYAYYHETSFEKKCYESSDVTQGEFDTITISCSYMNPTARLQICVADDLGKNVLTSGDNAEVPKCCYPSFPPETPVVCYDVEISCEPCVVQED